MKVSIWSAPVFLAAGLLASLPAQAQEGDAADGKKVCDAQLKLRTMPFSEVPLADIVRKRAEEVGLMDALQAGA